MAAAKKTTTPETFLNLTPIEQAVLDIEIKGKTPLIVHAWSQKAKQMMLDQQMGKKTPKQPKDPAHDYEASIYRLSDGRHGIPATALKSATIKGGRFFKGSVTMEGLKPVLYVHATDPATGLIAIVGEARPREDMVRVGRGTADIRYRAEYVDWSATVRVEFAPHMIDAQSVLALVDAGGRVGIGEWRPEKGGIYGTYGVVGS
jgi:hypothetical protein